jgi:GNAT superfamily N-acetyltransferase
MTYYEVIALDSVSEFRKEALPLLLRNEAENCLGIGVLESIERRRELFPEFYLFSIRRSGSTHAIAWWTPPRPLGVTQMHLDAVEPLANFLASRGHRPRAVVGPIGPAERFSAVWCSLNQLKPRSRMDQRIYQATSVLRPSGVTGQMRFVTDSDLTLLAEWTKCFADECNLGELSQDRCIEYARDAVKNQTRAFWIDQGIPVTMVGWQGPTPNGIRMSWVYTPPDRRRLGYASALVADATQHQLSSGKRMCFLYTDLSNPTSNSIYQKIGYHPVGDAVNIGFN